MLNKTNGYKALVRFLRPAYLHLCRLGKVPSVEQFLSIFNKINIPDFSTNRFKPGSSGEGSLYKMLSDQSGCAPNTEY